MLLLYFNPPAKSRAYEPERPHTMIAPCGEKVKKFCGFVGKSRNRQGLAAVTRSELEQEGHGLFCPLLGRGETTGATAKAAAQHIGIDDARIERNRRHAAGQF